MKPIIIDMKEMSDSTEVYDRTPHFLLPCSIYGILCMVVIAIVWMAFCKIDIVVKSTGMVVVDGEVSTITNQMAGVIVECKVEDGQSVNKGDVLYVIGTEDEELQLASYEKRYAENEQRIDMLEAYHAWLAKGDTGIETLWSNAYYSEIVSRKMLVQLSKEQIETSYEQEMSVYDSKLQASQEFEKYYNDSITNSEKLVQAMEGFVNPFSAEETYYYDKFEDYLIQYQNICKQYDIKMNVYVTERQNAEESIKEKQTSIAEIKQTIVELQAKIEEFATESVAAINDGGVLEEALSEVQLLLAQKEQAVKTLEDEVAEQQKIVDSCNGNIADYQSQKSIATDAYKKETIASIEASILSYKQNLLTYSGASAEYKEGKESLESTGIQSEVDNIIYTETNAVLTELSSCYEQRTSLEQAMQQCRQQLELATVKATGTGVVNLCKELVTGDYLNAGAEVMTIIPVNGGSTYCVDSYVENGDIAKIKEGMPVTYEIAAFPSREYGTLTGNVEFISADLKVGDNNGSAYYVVETCIDKEEHYNSAGDKVELKVGMVCETRIVVEQKSVLLFLLGKLKLVD